MAGPSRARLRTAFRSYSVAAARRLFFEPLEDRRPLAAAPLTALVISGPEPPLTHGADTVADDGLLTPSAAVFGEGEGSSTASQVGPLLFAGISDHSSDPVNAGMLTIIDPHSKTAVPWNSALAGGGLSGLAFDSTNRLFATIDRLPCSGSDLVELDPQTGAELRRMPVMAGSTPLSIGDLAIEPGTNRLLGIRSSHDDMNQAGQLYVIDAETGAATLLGDTGTGSGTSLAFTADGALYSGGVAGGKPVLYKIDPTTAEPHARDPQTSQAIPWKQIADSTGRLKAISGLVGDPSSNALWASASSTRFAANQTVVDLYEINPATGIAASAPLGAPARGILGDLAFQPVPRSLDVVYQEDFEDGPGGFTADNSGGTIPGLWHYSPGRRFDGLPSHTPTNSWYYGAFETAFGEGNYVLPYDHEGTLTSPPILIPTSSVLSFNYLLDVRDELIVDFASVFVITSDGTATRILSRADGTLEKTGTDRWATAAASLAAFGCQPIQIQFRFDTGPSPQIDPEGWYIDDVMIASTGGLCDFGDAPDGIASHTYPTLLASDGARHGAISDFFLGTRIDVEPDGQPTLLADGDDHDANGDDEDGVVFIPLDPARTDPVLFAGQPGLATVQLTNPSSAAAFLDAWIDFNQDGDWLDDGEQIATSSPLQPGANSVSFLAPAGAAVGDTVARFRLSSTGGLEPTGLAQDGEVEDHLVTIESWQPQVQVEKTGEWSDRNDNGRLDTADTIDYTFTVTNTGNVSLLNVTLVDPGVDLDPPQGLSDIDGDGDPDDLAVGQVAIWTGSAALTVADIESRQKENTVIVEADAPNDEPIQDDDTTIILLPSIAIEKTNTSPGGWDDANGNGRPDVGETISYLFSIANDGKLPLSDVILSDSIATVSTVSGLTDVDGDGPDDLAVGGTATATGLYVLTQADIDAAQRANTATVVAFDPAGNAVRGEDTNVTLLPTAAVELIKVGSWIDANPNSRPDLGDTISYSFQVTNTGNVTLFNVTLTDPRVTIDPLNGLTDEDADGVADDLRPGEIATAQGSYALTQADIDLRQKDNTATVTAQTPGGSPLEDEASARVLLPSVALEKTITSPGGWNDANGNGRPDVGETIDYLFTVTNDGKLPLLDLILTDSIANVSDLSGLTDEDDDGDADDLALGQVATATGQYALTQSDLDAEARSNTAAIDAVDPDDNSLRDEDSITTPLPGAPSIEIIKTGTWNDVNGNGRIDVGDSVAYDFEVTNTGNQTLTNIEVTDPLPGIGLIDPATLEVLLPGRSATFTATYLVQQSDLDDPDCAVNNTATVTANDPQGGELSSTGDHAFPILGAAITGSVFNDVDGDAFEDAAESGIGSVRVELFVDSNSNGEIDTNDALIQTVVTSETGLYQFAGLDAGEYLVRTVTSSLPATLALTTGFSTRAVTLGLCGSVAADFGYQGVIQFVTPLGAYRPDIPDTVVVPFVRPASDPIGDLLRDPERTLEAFLPFYAPYQSVSISNPSNSAMRVTGLEAVVESASIAAEQFVTVFTVAQLERLMEIELELDEHFANGQPVSQSLRAELDELLRGVTDPATQIPAISAGGSLELLAIYRPVEVTATSSGGTITSQLPNWASNANAEEGRSHTFGRTDRLEISTSAGQTIQFQLVGGSTFDGDVFNHNGLVDVDDIALVNAILLGDWPATPGEPAWDPTTDANTRFPNGAGATGGPAWPDVLRATTPVLKEIGFGDLGILNVEFLRNSRAPFLDLHGSPGARGVDYTADVSPEELSAGVAMTDAPRFANAANLELASVTVVLKNAIDGVDEVLTVDTGDTGIVVAQETFANGQRTLVLSHEGGIPATVSSYQQVLNTLRYANQRVVPTAGVRVIEVQAIGTLADFSFTKNGATINQTQGNIAVARLNVISAG